MTRRNLAIEVSQRATVTLVIDSGKVQQIQVKSDDDDDVLDVEMLLPYGFSSNPPKGSDVVLVQPDGDAELSVAVSAQHGDHRPRDLEEGEACLHALDGEILVFISKTKKLAIGARDATEKAVLGDTTKSELDPHWHATPWGPSGGMGVPLSPACFSSIVTVK